MVIVFLLLLQTNAPTQSPPAPPPCTAAEHRQFDFWLGDWEVRGPTPDRGPQPRDVDPRRVRDPRGGPAPTGAAPAHRTTHDPRRKRWHQSGGQLGVAAGLVGGLVGGAMVSSSARGRHRLIPRMSSASRGRPCPRAECVSTGRPRRTAAPHGRRCSTGSTRAAARRWLDEYRLTSRFWHVTLRASRAVRVSSRARVRVGLRR
jgi:hypothetical protein